MRMRRKLCYLVFVAIVIAALAAPFLRADKKVPFATMQKAVQTLVNPKDFKQEGKTYIRKTYELNDSDYDHIICYGIPSAMEVNEFCVVQAHNPHKKDLVKEKLQGRIDRQYKSFSGYAPRQSALLKNAVLYEKGDYVIMIIHKNAQAMKDAIDKLF